MPVFILLLIVALIIISLIPNEEEVNNIKSLSACSIHVWEDKKVEELNTSYKVCSRCKFLAGTDNQFEA